MVELLPFEFIVEGVPVSLQARRRQKLDQWKHKVREPAQLLWLSNAPPLSEQIQIDITYFYEYNSLDVYKMIKPIQDALIGLIYLDDKQITDTHGRKRDLASSFKLEDVSVALAQGIIGGKDFVYIKIDFPPDHTRLKYE